MINLYLIQDYFISPVLALGKIFKTEMVVVVGLIFISSQSFYVTHQLLFIFYCLTLDTLLMTELLLICQFGLNGAILFWFIANFGVHH